MYYANYDNTVASPSPVTGWYDVYDATTNPDGNVHATLPPNVIAMTADQWANRTNGLWAVANGVLEPFTITRTFTVTQQAIIALTEGVTVVSNDADANTMLAGYYAVDTSAQNHIQAEVISIMLSNAFTDGSSSVNWPDTSDVVHAFNVAQFRSFALAVGGYVAALFKVVNGTSTTLPPSTVTI